MFIVNLYFVTVDPEIKPFYRLTNEQQNVPSMWGWAWMGVYKGVMSRDENNAIRHYPENFTDLVYNTKETINERTYEVL